MDGSRKAASPRRLRKKTKLGNQPLDARAHHATICGTVNFSGALSAQSQSELYRTGWLLSQHGQVLSGHIELLVCEHLPWPSEPAAVIMSTLQLAPVFK